MKTRKHSDYDSSALSLQRKQKAYQF